MIKKLQFFVLFIWPLCGKSFDVSDFHYQSSRISAYVVALCIASTIVFSLVYVIYKKYRHKKEQIRIENQKFNNAVMRLKFSTEEMELIKKIASQFRIKDVYGFITTREYYNNTISLYLKKISSENYLQQVYIFSLLTNIRKKIGFCTPAPNGKIITTKEIPLQTMIHLKVGRFVYRSEIIDNTEQYLVTSIPEYIKTEHLKKNVPVIMSFYYPNHGHYHLKTQLRKVEQHGVSQLSFSHTDNVPLPRKRKSKRFMVHSSCDIYMLSDMNEKNQNIKRNTQMTGKMLDISAGGCRLSSYSDIYFNTPIKLKFDIGKKYAFNDIVGKTIRKTKSNGHYIYNIKFTMFPKSTRKRIMNAVKRTATAFR
jgi:hypothetical protein